MHLNNYEFRNTGTTFNYQFSQAFSKYPNTSFLNGGFFLHPCELHINALGFIRTQSHTRKNKSLNCKPRYSLSTCPPPFPPLLSSLLLHAYALNMRIYCRFKMFMCVYICVRRVCLCVYVCMYMCMCVCAYLCMCV